VSQPQSNVEQLANLKSYFQLQATSQCAKGLQVQRVVSALVGLTRRLSVAE
jgi:hypothetical protein